MKLINRPIKRIFAFGCSFTKYFWTTWPEILAYDLEVPFYNYGRSGAGNQYIANAVVQANLEHRFNQDDLIIVSWTNVCREDRWRHGDWVTPGNIYNQNYFNDKFVKEWADPVGYMIRDFASIHLTQTLIKSSGAQYHMLSMCDISNQIDQNGGRFFVEDRCIKQFEQLCKLYQSELDSILPSFFKVLWDNDIYRNKLLKDQTEIGDRFSDGHPNPRDHLAYLQITFINHKFRNETKDSIYKIQDNYVKFILDKSAERQKQFALYELTPAEIVDLRAKTLLKESLPVRII